MNDSFYLCCCLLCAHSVFVGFECFHLRYISLFLVPEHRKRFDRFAFLLLLCCKLTFIPSSCSLAPPTPSHAPSLMDQSCSTLPFLTPVSLFPPLFLLLCFLLCVSSHPSALSLLLCFVSLLSVSCLFLPSGDAAKRKAWKLNRVGSLRSIYANSLHNSEGKNTAVVDL